CARGLADLRQTVRCVMARTRGNIVLPVGSRPAREIRFGGGSILSACTLGSACLNRGTRASPFLPAFITGTQLFNVLSHARSRGHVWQATRAVCVPRRPDVSGSAPARPARGAGG